MLKSTDGEVSGHPTGGDHVPQEAPSAASPGGVCDFCLASGVPWELPVGEFAATQRRAPGTEQAGLLSEGSWLCCDPCAEEILRKRWSQVITRARNGSMQATGVKAPRSYYQALFDRVQAHADGPLRRRGHDSPPAGVVGS